MWIAIGIVIAAVVAWVVVDRLKLLRDERARHGASAWAEVGPGRTFHSTGWEDTVPPASVLPREAPRRAGNYARSAT
ncbi:MAG: hypothetical protein KGI87_11415 [Burkholderiales bacterium]|nr:hypothetical protein [Burkholderiales bacterium]